jgi:hypothetical protein
MEGNSYETIPSSLTFKFINGDDIRRWTPTSDLSFELLLAKVTDIYCLSGDARAVLKYEDTEGDHVTLGCESDLAELLRLKLQLARVFVHASTLRGKKVRGDPAFSDSETEDGCWTAKRLDKYLAKLGKQLATLNEGTCKTAHFVKILGKCFDRTDEVGRAKVVSLLKSSSESSVASREFLTKLAYSPFDLGLGRVSISARNLAGLAVSGQAELRNRDDASSDSETEEGKWRQKRFDKYLSRLSACLALVTAENPSSMKIARFLARGALKADDAGKERVVGILQEAAEANDAIKSVLSQIASTPCGLGLRREVSSPACALAAKILGINPPHTLSSSIGQQQEPRRWGPGRWEAGRGRGGSGHFFCPRGGREGRWRMLNKQETPHVRLVRDMTVPDETRMHPGQCFTKIWRVANSGDLPWDPEGNGLVLLHVGGDTLGAEVSTPQLSTASPPSPGETVDLFVEMRAPETPGRYEGFFRLARLPSGGLNEKPMRFGQRIWVRILVVAMETAIPMSSNLPEDMTLLIDGAKVLPEAVSSGPPSVLPGEASEDWVDVIPSSK